MSLLSMLFLVNKYSFVLLLPGKAILIDLNDLEDNSAVQGYVKQETDGLFYISDFQNSVPTIDSTIGFLNKSMMAVVKTKLL